MSDPAQHPLGQLTQVVVEHRRRLLHAYDAADLHQWRVHVRRIRSLMKYLPACRDRALRSAWRERFIVTNPARDWDVFIATTETLLPPASFGALTGAIRPSVRRQHARVLDMLGSDAWGRHLAEWQTFLDGLHGAALEPPPELLPEVLARAVRAVAMARAEDDRADWHRLRIAVKNLRYVADTLQQTPAGDPRRAPLIGRCEALQDVLGAWHDSIVQRELLEAPATTRALARIDAGADIRNRLTQALQARRRDLLRSARVCLGDLELEPARWLCSGSASRQRIAGSNGPASEDECG